MQARANRGAFDGAVLRRYDQRRTNFLLDKMAQLSALAQKQTPVDCKGLNAIYGLTKAHHSFDAPCLDWGFELTEPQATRTIAHLLNRGPDDVRAERLIAFYKALKSSDVPTLQEAKSAVVEAEVNRIDLMLKYQKTGKEKMYSALVIEAKFGHIITRGQLANYTKIVQKDRDIDNASTKLVVLGLDDSAMHGLKGRQWTNWRFVSWRDLWLRFERTRPAEDDPSLKIFLNWLWRRINL
ncbi:PD-(D/E)XK nuclease superfamily [Hoeflea sp. IMCC20628]|uniref:PD-(D/E)XK nuclease family protein n=1 Tax=Hoeflea sp. IMCC20628 TaxID=1620421 RepID=UPI00063BD556|nr:PD-(D/E)XK nuclease family protein [Hoeflea sp. IMCC20628]AKI01292.1 PD-(D/E)XK nuclease superfamily [Hoeflea sp. IMCC20628]